MSGPNNIKKDTISGVKWTSIENIALSGSQFLIGIVLARRLDPEDFGLVGFDNLDISAYLTPTVTTVDHHAFVTAYYGNGYNSSIEEPAPTVTTKDRLSIVNCQFIANEYSGGGQLSSLDQPNPAVLTRPKQQLVSAQYLMNPQYQSPGGSIDKPCFTLIARMDKMPPYLVTTEQGELAIAITEKDTPMSRKIKQFMAAYGIIDIRMRMLKISELKRIMGFPDSYILVGTQAEQKKFIGNAVEVNMSRVLCEALSRRLLREKKVAI